MDPAKHDEHDGEGLGTTDLPKDRPVAVPPVARGSEEYNMNHKNRGMAVIFSYSEFKAGRQLEKRECAQTDSELCKTTFKKLNYEVYDHKNLTKEDLLDCLDKVSQADHSDNDSLVVIFMSHGGVYKDKNKEYFNPEYLNLEYLEAYDDKILTCKLWRNFTPEKCPSLAGKPKMFFIQACRGGEADMGVQLQKPSIQSDSVDGSAIDEEQEGYAIPLYADMLMMWASYPGMIAFRSINGSVFIHFLTQVLQANAGKEDLMSMLVRTSREVATQYESNIPDEKELHRKKQIPQMMSTLIRKVYFQKVADGN